MESGRGQDGKRQRTDGDGRDASDADDVDAVLADAMAGFHKVREAIKVEKEQLKKDQEALEAEKAAMMTLGVTENDLIELNVGGTRIATKRSTLCQAEGSVLAAMFSGRWEDRMEKDPQGAIFLDVDPYCMTEFLNYLRRQKLTPPDEKASVPVISNERRGDWQLFLKFFGLHEYLGDLAPVPELPLRFDRVSRDLSLDHLGRVSCPSGSCSHLPLGFRFAICSTPLTATTVWRVKVTLDSDSWCMLGVRCDPNPTEGWFPGMNIYAWATKGQVFLNGVRTSVDGWDGLQADDEVFMRLDMRSSKLQMRGMRFALPFTLDLPRENNTWYVHASIWG